MWLTTVWRVTDLIKRRETSSCGTRPRVGGQPLRVEGETALAAALRLALALDGGVMPIQGPPGSGKTYTGARMIAAMVNAGLRVGVTANSHKVIRNLLDEVCRAADEIGRRPHLHPKGAGGSQSTSLACDLRLTMRHAFPLFMTIARSQAGPLGFGLVLTPSMRSTCSSSTRRPKCPLRTCWRFPRRRRPSSCLAILNNSINLRRAVIQMAWTRPRSIICWLATKLFPRIAGFSWKRPGVSIQRSALSHRNCFTKVGSIPVRD